MIVAEKLNIYVHIFIVIIQRIRKNKRKILKK